ncbi:MAG: PilN domain-containing protein [Pseudomonadota bacterium]
MIQINLLPHREIKRRARQRLFVAGTMAASAAGLVVVLLGHLIFQNSLTNQQARNEFLKKEIQVLDEKIVQIKQLREETEALLARKNVVETLQLSRTETVHVLDELVRQMPDGVHLKSFRQSGLKITLEGYAQSNARVSTLMENLERSAWLAGLELLESKQVTLNNQRLHEFSLEAHVKYDAEQDQQRLQQANNPASIPATGMPSTGIPAAGSPVKADVKPGAIGSIPHLQAQPAQGQPAQGQPNPGQQHQPALPASSGAKPLAPSPAAAQKIAPAGIRPGPLGIGVSPQSVGKVVTETIATGQKRSMP